MSDPDAGCGGIGGGSHGNSQMLVVRSVEA